MSDEPTYGHVAKTIPQLANDLTLAVIYGPEMLIGAVYFGRKLWDKLVQARTSALGEYEAEVRAIRGVIEREFELDPADPISHLLVDRLYCAACKRTPCPTHHQTTYQTPKSSQSTSEPPPQG